MWDTEMVTILRFVIGDNDTPERYTDDRLRKLILVAAQFTQGENSFEQEYEISIENETLRPDPTKTGLRDDAFVNLTVLKAACLLANGGLPKANRQQIAVVEGPYRFDGKGRLAGEQVIAKTWCEAYSQAQWEYSMNSRDPGRAILGPYRAAISRGAMCDGTPWR